MGKTFEFKQDVVSHQIIQWELALFLGCHAMSQGQGSDYGRGMKKGSSVVDVYSER